jgi:prepilin-type N-terminal cleavage/methylation domain-containing protein
MISKKYLTKTGFTLIEVMVSVSLFAVIIISVAGIFKLSIDAQRNAISSQNVQESLKYFLEVTAKEIRMAQANNSVCAGVPPDSIFSVTTTDLGDVLNFKNYYGQCVSYSLQNDNGISRFQITRSSGGTSLSGFISPAKIKINSLHFVLKNLASSSQPMITINLNANANTGNANESSMTLQTSITSRYYK